MNHNFSVGGVVVSQKGKVLVVSQHGTSWSLPKGHIEGNESPEQAGTREIEEETGIKQLNIIKELGSYDRFMIGRHGGEDRSESKTITIFLFTTNQDDLSPVDPGNPETRWVDPNKVSDLLSHPKDKEFYNSIQAQVTEFIKSSVK